MVTFLCGKIPMVNDILASLKLKKIFKWPNQENVQVTTSWIFSPCSKIPELFFWTFNITSKILISLRRFRPCPYEICKMICRPANFSCMLLMFLRHYWLFTLVKVTVPESVPVNNSWRLDYLFRGSPIRSTMSGNVAIGIPSGSMRNLLPI